MAGELYEVPTLVLLAAAVAVFAGLWLQGTSLAAHEEPDDGRPGARRRQLLWLAGWVLCVVRLALQVAGWNMPGWHLALSFSASVLAPLMFLASLAPQYVIRRPPVPFVAAFGLPIIAYCAMVGLHPTPGPIGDLSLLACTIAGIAVAVEWSLYEQLLPVWLSLIIVALIGGAAAWLTLRGDFGEVISLTHSGILLMTALDLIAQEENQQSPAEPGKHVPSKRSEHGRIFHPGTGITTKDRCWMLRAPPAVRHVHDGHVERAEDAEYSSHGLHLRSSGEAAQEQITDVNEPENGGGCEASVPRPPDAPCAASPQRPSR